MARILIVTEKVSPEVVASFMGDPFEEVVKYVVDVERGIIALGGELHADAEAVLIENGSSPTALWGANLYPRLPPERRIDYTALINIRPAQGNPGLEVRDPALRARIRELTEKLLLGPDERLP
jgi:hypothetical protein